MNIIRVTACILLLCLLTITAAWPVHAAVANQITPPVTPSATGPTNSPTLTSSATLTPSNTATTTLIPLPAITLIFPVSTPSPTATLTSTPAFTAETPQPQGNSGLNNLSPRLKLLAVLIALLWLILIGFAIIFIRQFK